MDLRLNGFRPEPAPRRRASALSFIAVACVAAAIILFFLDPAVTSIYPSCPLHTLTGLYCPGCGGLRALHQTLHGNLSAALRLNPLFVLALPLILYELLLRLVSPLTGRPVRATLLRFLGPTTLLAAALVYFVLRNLPFFPFTLLAPR